MSDFNIDTAIKGLYLKHLKKQTKPLLDTILETAALTGIVCGDRIVTEDITDQMRESFNLAFPQKTISSLESMSNEQLEGIVNAWKGKYFEVLVRDKLNAGEQVGDFVLENGQTAQLATDLTQKGWDLQIVDADGSILQEVQLKATSSLSYIKEAIANDTTYEVLSTSEISGAAGAIDSGISNEELTAATKAPLESLIDSELINFLENYSIAFSFLIIIGTEGYQASRNKQTSGNAWQNIKDRSLLTSFALSAGVLAANVLGAPFSIPASLLTRMGLNRYKNTSQIKKNLGADVAEIEKIKYRQILNRTFAQRKL